MIHSYNYFSCLILSSILLGASISSFFCCFYYIGQHNPCTESWAGLNCTCNQSTSYTHFYDEYYYDDRNRAGKISCNIEKFFLVNIENAIGSLPPSIGNFSLMTHLHLGKNSIYGSIPNEITKLTSLQIFSLFSSSFSGSIPSLIGALSSLRYLSISFNFVTGTLPSSLGGLVNLEELKLRGSSLAGIAGNHNQNP